MCVYIYIYMCVYMDAGVLYWTMQWELGFRMSLGGSADLASRLRTIIKP